MGRVGSLGISVQYLQKPEENTGSCGTRVTVLNHLICVLGTTLQGQYASLTTEPSLHTVQSRERLRPRCTIVALFDSIRIPYICQSVMKVSSVSFSSVKCERKPFKATREQILDPFLVVQFSLIKGPNRSWQFTSEKSLDDLLKSPYPLYFLL